jgi:hypothetical protein
MAYGSLLHYSSPDKSPGEDKRMNSSQWCRGMISLCAGALLWGCQHAANRPAPQAVSVPAMPAASLQRGPTLADLVGGELGVGGGFLIGAAPQKITSHQRAEAVAAAQHAEQSPAQLLQVRESKTADLNNDGYVTLDEVMAMVRAGLTPGEIGQRLSDTHYQFRITPEQQRYLTDRGVKPDVIAMLQALQESSANAVATSEH